MAIWPFSKVFGAGLVSGDVPTHSQMNLLDEQQAQAADGLVYSDVSWLRSWQPPVTLTDAGDGITFPVPFLDEEWWHLYIAGTTQLNGTRRFGGAGLFVSTIGAIVAGVLQMEKRAVAYDPVAQKVVVGVTPTASSNQKYRRANVGVNPSFGAGVSSQTNATGVGVVGWAGSLGMLISGLLGTGVLETSIDGGATWTQRTAPNSEPRLAIAVGTPGVVMTSTTAQSHLIQSADGITWTQRTLPASKIWSVVWVPALAKFVALAEDLSSIAQSADGITWTTVTTTQFPGPGSSTLQSGADAQFHAFGKTIIGAVKLFAGGTIVLVYSQDLGATWRTAATLSTSGNVGFLGCNGRQVVYVEGTTVQSTFASGVGGA